MFDTDLINNIKGRNEKPYTVSIVVTSDTCSKDESKDESGNYVMQQIERENELFSRVTKRCVKDDKETIRRCILDCLDQEDPALILTIGGTGLCPRDVTPEATSSLYDRSCNGIATALLMTSLRYSPHAALSRLTAGIVGECLIVNFPGSLKACQDCFICLNGFIGHALEQVRFNCKSYNDTHSRIKNRDESGKSIWSEPSVDKQGTTTKKPSDSFIPINFDDLLQPIVIPATTLGGNNSYSNNKQHKQRQDQANEARDNGQHGSAKEQKTKRIGSIPDVHQRLSRPIGKELHCDASSSNSQAQPNQQSQQQQQIRLKKSLTNAKKFTSLDDLSSRRKSKSKERPNFSNNRAPLMKLLNNSNATESVYPMVAFEKSHEILEFQSQDLLTEKEEIILDYQEKAYKLIGYVLAEDLKSKNIIPPFAVSTMDGFVLNVPASMRKMFDFIRKLPPATLVSDLKEFKERQAHPQASQTFFAYRINTGGRLPEKNFAIVPVEKTEPLSNQADTVTIHEAKLGLYQRQAGSDMTLRDGLSKGTVIGPVELSLILAMGHRTVTVFKPPRMGILSTGDELCNFFSNNIIDTKDCVVDINGPLLTSVFRSRNYHTYNNGICKDDPSQLMHSIRKALHSCEVLIVTGGASMGTKDYVKDVIRSMGGIIHFGRVNMKPGKPVAFASIFMEGKRKFIFSLPGNPVSAYMTSMLLVVPFMENGIRNFNNSRNKISLDCLGEFIKVVIAQTTDEAYEFDGRLEFVRAKIIATSPTYSVTVSMKQQSSRLLSLKDCDCLIMIPPSRKGQKLTIGQSFTALKINRPL